MSELADIWHRTPEERHSDELNELRVELAVANKRIELEVMNADAWKMECEKARAELATAIAECEEQARLNGMGAERELKLRAELSVAQNVVAVAEAHEEGWINELAALRELFEEALLHVYPAEQAEYFRARIDALLGEKNE